MRLLMAAQHRKNMALREAEKESKLANYDLFRLNQEMPRSCVSICYY
jgi:hypothetical protein